MKTIRLFCWMSEMNIPFPKALWEPSMIMIPSPSVVFCILISRLARNFSNSGLSKICKEKGHKFKFQSTFQFFLWNWVVLTTSSNFTGNWVNFFTATFSMFESFLKSIIFMGTSMGVFFMTAETFKWLRPRTTVLWTYVILKQFEKKAKNLQNCILP